MTDSKHWCTLPEAVSNEGVPFSCGQLLLKTGFGPPSKQRISRANAVLSAFFIAGHAGSLSQQPMTEAHYLSDMLLIEGFIWEQVGHLPWVLLAQRQVMLDHDVSFKLCFELPCCFQHGVQTRQVPHPKNMVRIQGINLRHPIRTCWAIGGCATSWQGSSVLFL